MISIVGLIVFWLAYRAAFRATYRRGIARHTATDQIRAARLDHALRLIETRKEPAR